MSRSPKLGSVGPQHLKRLKDAQAEINAALVEIQKLEAAGQDCSADRQLCDHYDRQIRRLLAVYFPEG